jgi:hypothetical protein
MESVKVVTVLLANGIIKLLPIVTQVFRAKPKALSVRDVPES